MHIHCCDTLTSQNREAVLGLALAQEAHQQAHSPGLLATHTLPQLEARWHQAPLYVLAVDASGRLRGAAQPAVWRLKRESLLRAFVAGSNGVAQGLLLPAPQEPDTPAVVDALVNALTTFWREEHPEADLIRWPSAETWLAPLIARHGFALDSVCAWRSLTPFFAQAPTVPAGVQVRLAQPSDEATLIQLFHEELSFHERMTPFVCSSPPVLRTFQQKLRRVWAGEGLEDGAPLVVIAERDHQIIALAENTLVTIDEQEEPGFTPPGTYWCIENVSVSEPFHRQGIGRWLVHAIEQVHLMLDLKVRGYLLWYNPDNTVATQFWDHRGFTPLWTTYQRRLASLPFADSFLEEDDPTAEVRRTKTNQLL